MTGAYSLWKQQGKKASTMPRVTVLLLALLITACLAHHRTDDDFAFDNNDEMQIDVSVERVHPTKTANGLKRLWGVADTSAYVGRLFRLEIPKEAFSGEVATYKVRSANRKSLPKWMAVDSKHGILTGIPAKSDIGSHLLSVTAYGRHPEIKAVDTFTIEVRKDSHRPQSKSPNEKHCEAHGDELILVILLDIPFHTIKPQDKIKALMNLANFMALDGDSFSIDAYNPHHENKSNYTIVLSGPGSIRQTANKEYSAIYLNVGCSGHMWTKHKLIVHQLREQARDGTISDLIHLPVFGWKVTSHVHQVSTPLRSRRQVMNLDDGSGLYDDVDDIDADDDYSGYDDEDYNTEDDPITEVDPAFPLPRTTTSTAKPTTPSLSTTSFQHIPTTVEIETPTSPPHPHRHHHGETSQYEQTFAERNNLTFEPVRSTVPTVGKLHTISNVIEQINSSETTPQFPVATTNREKASESFATSTETTPEATLSTTVKLTTISITAFTNPASTPPPIPSIAVTTTPWSNEDTTSLVTTAITSIVNQITDKPVEIVPFVVDKSSKRTMSGNNEVPLVTTEEVFPVVIVPESVPSTTTSRATTTPFTIVILPSNNTPEVVSASTIHPVVVTTVEENNPPLQTVPVKPITTTPAVPIETTVEDISTTLQDIVTSTEKTSTIIGRTTETIDFTIPVNSPPVLKHRLKKLAVTAGKAVRYIIPEDLFTDAEDGTKLTLSMFDIDNAPLKATSWIQFISDQREVYGLPLEEDVSKWEYIIRATDSKGESAQDHLDITVQHHKGRRVVNHEFKMKLKVVQKYPSPVDWQIRVLEGLVNLFRDTDMDYMTVRNAVTHADHVEFVWTNDTFPKNICPTADIKRLMGILQSNEDGSPSAALSDVMSPEMKVKSVTWSGLNVCQAAPSTPPSAPPRHPDNFAPVPRNQVDHIHAVVGTLLVFKVPEDTFFDPEDGSARNLKMWVVRGDRSPLPEHHWLQFDTKNQEFYGLPTERDIGRKDYQLVSEDSGGKTANDGLIVEVHQAPTIKPNVEFVMTFEEKPLSKQLLSSALVKRKFIEKLADLFGDSDASSIRIKSISDKPISVTWYNTSLPMDRCPDDEIQRLQKMIVRDDETLTDKVNQGLYEYDVMSVRLTPRGVCAGRDTPVYRQEPGRRAEATDGRKESVRADDYLLTFVVPAVVLVCMVLVAGLVACALYRRRRSGKMSVGDDEERQAFRSKGIPVIFQDELDEKPDPSNKSPVIMKEEKPPLLPPPEYAGEEGGSPTPSHRAPYHPPPPFTASRESARQARPKATPTYRKPPPYVPP